MAYAASDAYPWPQNGEPSRQPIATAGITSGMNSGTDSPVKGDQFARGQQLDGEESEARRSGLSRHRNAPEPLSLNHVADKAWETFPADPGRPWKPHQRARGRREHPRSRRSGYLAR